MLYGAIYFRTGNLWVTVFLHGRMDILSMLMGGLYGTETQAESVSGYDITMLSSVLVYPSSRRPSCCGKKKIGEVRFYFKY